MLTCSSLLRKSSQSLKRPEVTKRCGRSLEVSRQSAVAYNKEVHMSDEELEVLITLDDPWYGPDEDTFHLQPDTGQTLEWSR
jgi:hypothetical protein